MTVNFQKKKIGKRKWKNLENDVSLFCYVCVENWKAENDSLSVFLLNDLRPYFRQRRICLKSVPYGRRFSHSHEGFFLLPKHQFCVFLLLFSESRTLCVCQIEVYNSVLYFFLYDRYITYAFKHYELISASQRRTFL